jgi:hypothetical protein
MRILRQMAFGPLCAAMCTASSAAFAQTSLSQNSGINSADTWVTADVTFSVTGSATFSSPIYIPST